MYDVKITNGTIVDGTGDARFVGDVAVKDGAIAEVSRSPLPGDAAETIDATGLLVTPGFVDVHTHYDGQATWDPLLEPSSGHGVTTVVAGNCGVGFAPCARVTKGLIQPHGRRRDIRTFTLTRGSTGAGRRSRNTSGTLDRRRFRIDMGVGSPESDSCLRKGAGAANRRRRRDRGDGRHRAGTVEAGALGFSTSARSVTAMDGRPVPARSQPRTSCCARSMRRAGGGVFDSRRSIRETCWRLAGRGGCAASRELDLPSRSAVADRHNAGMWRGLIRTSLALDAGAEWSGSRGGMLLGFPARRLQWSATYRGSPPLS
jgi:N-acyl-D-aspartate/D-glutamate deacylase